LKFPELKDYRGERAQRGAVLPRGWRKVERLEAELLTVDGQN
jgi:topoisomerase IV subunit A